eukprot:COSAG05_NODE_4036_length_1706_cov_1.614810_2_plen_120_part_00
MGALMTTSDATAASASEDGASKIAAEVEAACFTQCAQSGEVDGFYKAKLRVLLASIKQQVSRQCRFCVRKIVGNKRMLIMRSVTYVGETPFGHVGRTAGGAGGRLDGFRKTSFVSLTPS